MTEKRVFGILDGQEVPVVKLYHDNIEVELLPFGAAIRSLRVRDRNGNWVDVCLGYDELGAYQRQDGCLGGTIGRYANRIGGAAFTLNGETIQVTANEGANCLHGGTVGFHKKLWRIAARTDDFVTFAYVSPDREEGFPGNLSVRVTYALLEDGLAIDYEAVTDQDTIVNLTNHAYFNLAGQNGGVVTDHELMVRAEAYTPSGADNVPTGRIASVDGTPLDLRRPAVLGDMLRHPFLYETRGYDHNFILDKGGDAPAAVLYCPRTGIGLELRTDMEGMQLYTAGFLTERSGKDGAVYGPAHAVCLETQHFPDAINKPGFPSPILRPGEVYKSLTSWKFFTN